RRREARAAVERDRPRRPDHADALRHLDAPADLRLPAREGAPAHDGGPHAGPLDRVDGRARGGGDVRPEAPRGAAPGDDGAGRVVNFPFVSRAADGTFVVEEI